MFYNKLLEEAFLRYDRIMYSFEYLEAIKIFKTKNKSDSDVTKMNLLFEKSRKNAEFSDHQLQSFATHLKNNSFFIDHLGGEVPQVIATKVFRNVSKYLFRKSGRTRFKTKGATPSIECKSQRGEFQFNNGKLRIAKCKTVNGKRKPVEFNLIFDHKGCSRCRKSCITE